MKRVIMSYCFWFFF